MSTAMMKSEISVTVVANKQNCKTKLTDDSQMQQANIKRLIQVSKFAVQQSKNPIRRHHQSVHAGTEQEQEERDADQRVNHAEQLSSITNRSHMAVSDRSDHSGCKEQRLTEAPVHVIGTVLQCGYSVLAGHDHRFKEVLQFRFWNERESGGYFDALQ